MVSAWLYTALIGAVAAERLVELSISRRHAAWAMARGGREYGATHFRWMKLLHGGLLVGCVGEVWLCRRPFIAQLGYPMLALVLLAQATRYWVVATLGPQWNTRVIVIPDAPVITGGPYRYLRHPNYAAVVLEGVALPLVHTAYLTAAVFTLLNLNLLRVRIRCEEAALAKSCNYSEAFSRRRRPRREERTR